MGVGACEAYRQNNGTGSGGVGIYGIGDACTALEIYGEWRRRTVGARVSGSRLAQQMHPWKGLRLLLRCVIIYQNPDALRV